jgi:hypothetical protein
MDRFGKLRCDAARTISTPEAGPSIASGLRAIVMNGEQAGQTDGLDFTD